MASGRFALVENRICCCCSMVHSNRLAMFNAHDRPTQTLARILHTFIQSNSTTQSSSNLLASHALHPNHPRTPQTSAHLLGRHRYYDLLEPKYTNVGNVQHHRLPSPPSSRPRVSCPVNVPFAEEGQGTGARGGEGTDEDGEEEKVGLECGGDILYVACWRPLFCHGVGGTTEKRV